MGYVHGLFIRGPRINPRSSQRFLQRQPRDKPGRGFLPYKEGGRFTNKEYFMKLKLFFAALAAVLIAPALLAQAPNLHFEAAGSLPLDATFGLFGSDIDDIQDVNNYPKVEFTKGFGYALAGTNTGVAGGFAKTFGNLFVGINYDGYLWDGNNTVKEISGKRVDSISDTDDNVKIDNRFGVLIGSESFGGIKVLFDFDDFHPDTDKIEAAPKEEVKYTTGSIFAGALWGKNFALGGGLLKPEFGLGVDFDLDNEKYKGLGGSYTTKEGKTTVYLRAAADYEFAPQGSTTSTLSGEYTLSIGRKPDPVIEVKNQTFPAGWWGAGGTVDKAKASDKGSDVGNDLSIAYSKTYNIDERWAAAWGIGGDLGFDVSKTKPSASATVSGTTITYKSKGTTTTTFTVDPEASAALKYNFATKPFTLYAGAKLTAGISVKKEDVKNTKTVTKTYTFTPLTPQFALGGSLKPTENFAIDMKLEGNTNMNGFNFHFGANSIDIALQLSLKL
jgi:hypothetical protein